MKKLFLGILVFLASHYSFAAKISMTQIPNGWKLENYFGDSLVVYFSGSQCEKGRLSFPATATNDDKNRFWSLILAAKASQSKVFIQYQDDQNCTIVSFASI